MSFRFNAIFQQNNTQTCPENGAMAEIYSGAKLQYLRHKTNKFSHIFQQKKTHDNEYEIKSQKMRKQLL